jgi:hypothetical protein
VRCLGAEIGTDRYYRKLIEQWRCRAEAATHGRQLALAELAQAKAALGVTLG